MNRAERRRQARLQRDRERADQRATAAGFTVQRGLTGACLDCTATADLVSCSEFTVGHVFHDQGCPAATGVTDWRPANA